MSTDVAQLSIMVDSTDCGKATQAMDTMTQSGSRLEAGIKTLMGAWAAWKVGDKVADIALLAARNETLGVAMVQVGHNAGYSADQMRTFEEQLRRTGISEIEAQSNLTKMAAANLDLAQASKLARIAQDAAVIGNVNSSEAFATLVLGIQSGRTEILHNIGIMPNFEQAYKKAADAVGGTVDSLSQTEKTTARLNAVLEQGELRAGVYEAAMGTAGKQIKSMERYIQDLEVAVGNTFLPALTAGTEGVTEAFHRANDAMKEWAKTGGQQVFANNLKNDLVSVSNALMGATKFTYEHRDALTVLAGAYAGLKVSKFVPELVAWVTAVRAGAMASVDAARAEVAAATNKALLAQASVVEAWTITAEAEAKHAATIASNELASAEGRLAAAESASSIAATGAKSAVTALGGPITIIITLLGAAAAAWWAFRDSSDTASKDVLSNADAQIRKTEEQIKKQKEFWGPKGAEALRDGTNDSPAVKALDKLYGELQSKQAKLEAAANGGMGVALNKALGIGGTAVATQEQLDTENKMREVLEKRAALVELLNNARIGADQIEKMMIRKPGGGASDGTGKAGDELTEYGRELNRLREEYLLLTKGEEAAYEMKLKLMDNAAPGSVDEAKNLKLNNELIAAEHTLLASSVDGMAQWAASYDDLTLKAKLAAASERDQIEISVRAAAVGKDWISEEMIQGEVDLRNKILDTNQAMQARKSLEQEAGRLNQKDDFSTRLNQLNAVSATGKLTEEAYYRELVKIHQQAGSLIGNSISSMKSFGESASDALAKWATGMDSAAIHWRDMTRSMLTDLAKLEAQKGFDTLLGYAAEGLASMLGGNNAIVQTNMDTNSITDLPGGGGTDLSGVQLTPSYAGRMSSIAAGPSSIDSKVSVTIHNNGNVTSDSQTTDGGEAMGRALESAVVRVIQKQQRPGGILNTNRGSGRTY